MQLLFHQQSSLPVTPTVLPPNPFVSLAPEIKQSIFSLLPDVPTLRSAALTCTSFYHTFFDAESILLSKVLQNQIHPDLFTDAFAVFRSSGQGPAAYTWSRENARTLLTIYDSDRFSCLNQHKWNFQEALSLSSIHIKVQQFADEFTSSALPLLLEGISQDSRMVEASLTERHRIERTFYRFELYCNLFRTREPTYRKPSRSRTTVIPVETVSPRDQRDIFFARFPVWENEQLACIRDYLSRRLSMPFNDVAEHDILWGELGVAWANDSMRPDNPWVERFLMRGLAFIRRLENASTFADRCTLLDWESPPEDLSLVHGLREQDEGGLFRHYSLEAKHRILNPSCDGDTDAGPKDAWLWAHEDCLRLYYHLYGGHRTLRRWGYVFWDSARWKQLRFLDTDYFAWRIKTLHEEKHQDRRGYPYKEMRASWQARSQIWCRGGRGYWSKGDESRVQWPAEAELGCESPQRGTLVSVEMRQKLQCWSHGFFGMRGFAGW